MAIAAVLAGLLGACIGSFMNVVAYRLPRGESLAHPPSACPHCGTPIKPYDNVPVLGWLWLRGRCRACGAGISPRYPIVEAATALLCVSVVLLADGDAQPWLGLLLVLALVPITLIDLDTQLIPDKITAPTAVLALVLVAALASGDLVEHVVAGLGAGSFFFVVVMAYPKGMGLGDAKLAVVLGFALGRDVAVAIFVALLVGSIVGGAIMARRGVAEGRKTKVPFGPFLALGAVVALLAGDPVVDWYLDTFA